MKEEETTISPDSIVPQTPRMGKAESVYIRIPEAMTIMECSRSTAQRCFTEVNKKMKARGCFVISGRCNRLAFYQAIGLSYDGHTH